jgi:disulfide bond formation protein DsbB
MSLHLTSRRLFAAAAILVTAAVSAALYLQHVVGVKPCPLCILQRMSFIAAAVLALIALIAGRGMARSLVGGLASLVAATGLGVAAWHTWLLAHPPESLGCGRPFEWFNEDFPLVTWLPRLFRGEGDCLAVDWTFLGLAVPHLSLITAIVLTTLLALGTKKAWSERSTGGRLT